MVLQTFAWKWGPYYTLEKYVIQFSRLGSFFKCFASNTTPERLCKKLPSEIFHLSGSTEHAVNSKRSTVKL